jgi:hypothetical protein
MIKDDPGLQVHTYGGFVMKIEDIKALEALPPSTLCRLIAFDRAQVVPGFIPKTFFLIVSGEKPWASMKVELVPLVFVQRPDYWGIEVIGCQSGIGLPVKVPYSVVLDITHVLGKHGIEVIGANRKEQIKVP